MNQQEINERYTVLCQQYGDLSLKREKLEEAILNIKSNIKELEEASKRLAELAKKTEEPKAINPEIVGYK